MTINLTHEQLILETVPQSVVPLDALKALEADVRAGNIKPSSPGRLVAVALTDDFRARGVTTIRGEALPAGHLVIFDTGHVTQVVGPDMNGDGNFSGWEASALDNGSANELAGWLNGDEDYARAGTGNPRE